MRHRLQLGAILLLTFVVFLPEIHYSLVYDDLIQIVGNRRLTAWSYVPGYFTTHLWAQVPNTAPIYYRPVFLIWLRLLDATLGAPGAIWHLASIVAHLVATTCVFLLIRRLAGDFKGAVLATALFAIHPIQTETVAWVSSCGDLLLTSFLVLSVYFYAKRKGPISFPSLVFAAFAMLTKEPGIVAPALILTYEWIQSNFKNAVLNTSPYALPALLYVALRVNALGGPLTGGHPKLSVGGMVLTWPRLLAVYASHLVWPVHLGPTYDVPIGTALWPLLLLIAVVAGLLWLLRDSCANIRFGAAWFAITLAPALAIRYMTWDDYVHDRYLYLPSVGLALIAAVWFSRVRFTRPKVASACALALALCCETRSNLRIWKDDVSLFSRAVQTAPGNESARNNLAYAYLNADRARQAYPLLKQIIKVDPGSVNANYNMGRYYQQVGNMKAAKRYFSIAQRLFIN